LFREYIAQLVEFNKKFLVIGNINAILYKVIFPLLKNNTVRVGNSAPKYFDVPDGSARAGCDTRWFGNIECGRVKPPLVLTKHYSESEYPKYDNYDAIEVSKTKDIPMDYFGAMGVPITFMDKFNSNQFEILGLAANKRSAIDAAFIQGEERYLDELSKKFTGMVLKEKNGIRATYVRIIIRRKVD
jgi:hypothetical protein